MKNIKVLLMRNAAKIALACSAFAVFSTCSTWRSYEPKVTDDLKNEIKTACKR
ncbi:MAG: hypothetical protein ACRC3H_24045 [Lachnospiraceae bacterium]